MPKRKKNFETAIFYRLKNWFLSHKVLGIVLFGLFVLLLGMTFFNQCYTTKQNIDSIVANDAHPLVDGTANISKSGEVETYKTAWFNKDDPSIEFWRKFDLPKQVGAPIFVGNCPFPPCVSFEIKSLSLPPDKPNALISIGVLSAGITTSPRAFNIAIELEKGCGGSFRTREHDFVFEIVDDRVSSLTGVIAFFPGNAEHIGFTIDTVGCR